MKISYTGKTNLLTEAQTQKLQLRLSKLAKFLDMKQGEREAHIALRVEKRSHYVDVSVLYKGEVLATTGEGADMFVAAGAAIERLERQVNKVREKKQDSRKRVAARADKRGKTAMDADVVSPSFREMEKEAAQVPNAAGVTVHRVNHAARRKPMSVDEAVLAIRKNQNYLVFRDMETENVAVLIRRADGEFDLVQTSS